MEIRLPTKHVQLHLRHTAVSFTLNFLKEKKYSEVDLLRSHMVYVDTDRWYIFLYIYFTIDTHAYLFCHSGQKWTLAFLVDYFQTAHNAELLGNIIIRWSGEIKLPSEPASIERNSEAAKCHHSYKSVEKSCRHSTVSKDYMF